MHRVAAQTSRRTVGRRRKADAAAPDAMSPPPAGRTDAAAATADRIEQMLRASKGKETDYVAPASRVEEGEAVAARPDGAVAGAGEEARGVDGIKVDTAAALRGKRAEAVAAWYKEKKKAPGGDLSTIIRQRALFESPTYQTLEEQSKVYDHLWTAFNVLVVVALVALAFKFKLYTGRRYFHEVMEEMRENYALDENMPTEISRQEAVLKQYGWYFRWKEAVMDKQRDDKFTDMKKNFTFEATNATETWNASAFRAYNTWDWMLGRA
eukprot:TRINITY_DN27190_c0_g1_i1.p1 TRINITY_DN27190_c0_g1~~TRINITY_DN27190_c0_g1_i1.p1  ORF type:complete len:267 (+),score=94.40 TRINITY_DN27190_c0_g1_i1:75-875(+)